MSGRAATVLRTGAAGLASNPRTTPRTSGPGRPHGHDARPVRPRVRPPYASPRTNPPRIPVRGGRGAPHAGQQGPRAGRRGRAAHRRPPAALSDPGGIRGARRDGRPGGAGGGAAAAARGDRPRHRAAGAGRDRGVPRAARGRRLDAGAAGHGTRRRSRPGARSGTRRGRLRHQTLLAPGTGRPGQDGAAPRGRTARGRGPARGTGRGRPGAPYGRGRRSARGTDGDRVRPARPSAAPSRPGLPREQLLAQVWGQADYRGSRTVDVHVAQLRAKLGDASPIRTVRGVGYSAADPAR